MNIIALIHLLAGLLVIAVSVPLIRRKVPVNAIYGFRIDEARKSEQHWYDINEYGGRLLLRWGFLMISTSLFGIVLPQSYWLTYAYTSLFIFLAGFVVVLFKVDRFARKVLKL